MGSLRSATKGGSSAGFPQALGGYFPAGSGGLRHRLGVLSKARGRGAGPCLVNTIHNQALDELGDGVRVSARSADGAIEAAELPGEPWFVGVQWHPELLPGRPSGDALFAALVGQCR